MPALHFPNIGGELSAAMTDVDTTMSSPALTALPEIAAPDIAHICMDPDGIAGSPEWMQITAHTTAADTATVTRATEGSTARAHKSGVEWVHTLAPSEWDALAKTLPAVAETTTARTLQLTDAGYVVEATNAGATTITVPPNASVAFPVGTIINVYSAGAGGVTIAAGAGVTIRNMANLAQYKECSLRKRATDEWVQAG